MPTISLELGLAVGGIVLTLVLVVLDKAGKLKGQMLYLLLALAGLMTLPLMLGNSFVAEAPALWKYWLRAASVSTVILIFWAIGIWISPKEVPTDYPPKPHGPTPPSISDDSTKTREPAVKSDYPARIALSEPVIHIEPENQLMWSTSPGETVGVFKLTFANTGMEDIDHVRVIEDYFVALKSQNGVIIKNLGGVPVNSGVYESLDHKKSCPLLIDFRSHVDVMGQVVKNNAVPNMSGIRLTITFRRKADGRDYRMVKGYGTIGPQAQGMFPPGIPQDQMIRSLSNKGFLSMSEVAPYLDVPECWMPVTHEIGQDEQGNRTSRYY